MTDPNKTNSAKTRFIIIMSIVAALIIALTVVGNCLTINVFDIVLTDFFGSTESTSTPAAARLDTEYHKSGFKTEAALGEAEKKLSEEIAAEGIVLLENDNCLPLPAGTELSFFSRSSVDLVYSGKDKPVVTLKDAFLSAGYKVNETLWKFYESGAGSSYRRGEAGNWALNECPLSVIRNADIEGSFAGTVPVFVLSRLPGEGRDAPRGMYDYARSNTDKAKHYLEPDTDELAVINYLDANFENVVLLVNAANAVELGWVENYPNIKAVVNMPPPGADGLTALARIFSGKITPSGKLADTYVYDNFSAPAVENAGDFRFTGSGAENYYYVSYNESVYVGYRYYETRYEDAVIGRAGTGAYDYAGAVRYPFGYGLSYASFAWSDMSMTPPDAEGEVTVSINVRNSSALFSGKEVVQIYYSSPYTDYDKTNGIEKPAVVLCGYAKTELLAPGEEETVRVSFNIEEFKAYNENLNAGKGGYILDAGRYYVTAAADAHAAVNNVLAAKYADGESVDPGKMVGAGSAAFVEYWDKGGAADEKIYANDSASGATVNNKFAHAELGGVNYLSRSDWAATYPAPNGSVSSVKSAYGERANGSDGVTGYQYTREATTATLLRLRSADSLNPASDGDFVDFPITDRKNGTELIDLRGLAYNDKMWDELLSNLSKDNLNILVSKSGNNTADIGEIRKPRASDGGSPTGLDGAVFPCANLIACTWNDALAERMGELVGERALFATKKTHGWYAPSVNIHRTPFGGKNAESYSEDVLLSGLMGAATVKGAAEKGMYSFVRYFALCNQENHRNERGLATYADEQTVREIYLKPFETVVKCGTRTIYYFERHENEDGLETFIKKEAEVPVATAVMTSSNRIGETWAGGDYNLITGVLRNEWGFNGFVLSDEDLGGYMSTAQMLRAGGDAKRNPAGIYTDALYKAADAHYAMKAAKNILYCTVNSSLMNGYIHGVAYVPGFPYFLLLVIAFDILAAASLVVIAIVVIRKLKPRKAPSAA